MKEWIVKLKTNKTATVDGKPADKYMQNMALCQTMDRLIVEIEQMEKGQQLLVEEKGLGRKETDIEEKVHRFLEEQKIVYCMFSMIGCTYCSWHMTVDFLLPFHGTVIECDGDYWHSTDKIKRRDEMKTEVLQKSGFMVLRLKGSDIKNNWEMCKQKILSVLQSSPIKKLHRQVDTEHAMVEAQRDELHIVHKIVDCAKPLHERYMEILHVLKTDKYFVSDSDYLKGNNFKKALEEAEK